MGAIASLITSLTIVYSTVYSDADQTKHQSSASLGTGEFPTQMASNAEMFPFDDVIMSMIKIKSIFNFLHIKHIPSFLSLFLLAKIWQVCSFDRLLLAKIWQVCSFDRLSDCLSVCLFVRNFFDTGHSFWYIFTKLDPSMYLCHVTMPIVLLGQRSNN